MFQLLTQPSCIVLGIATVRSIILLMKQDDDDSDWELSKDESEDSGKSTLSSNIEEDDLDNL